MRGPSRNHAWREPDAERGGGEELAQTACLRAQLEEGKSTERHCEDKLVSWSAASMSTSVVETKSGSLTTTIAMQALWQTFAQKVHGRTELAERSCADHRRTVKRLPP